MWSRQYFPSLSNSASLRYSISLSSSDHSDYSEISIDYFNPARLRVNVHIKDPTLSQAFSKALDGVGLGCRFSSELVVVDIQADECSLVTLFEMINDISQTGIPIEDIQDMYTRMKNAASPLEKTIWCSSGRVRLFPISDYLMGIDEESSLGSKKKDNERSSDDKKSDDKQSVSAPKSRA